jgi:hypothetical protein
VPVEIAQADQLSAGRSDDVSEHSHALGSGSWLRAKSTLHEGILGWEKPTNIEPRANPCINWLPVLC